jgi:hypothetical protein
MENAKILRIPLYNLYYLESITDDNLFGPNFVEHFRKKHEREKRFRIFNALIWAKENPSYDFKDLLPDLRFNNEEILIYLDKLYNVMLQNNLND